MQSVSLPNQTPVLRAVDHDGAVAAGVTARVPGQRGAVGGIERRDARPRDRARAGVVLAVRVVQPPLVATDVHRRRR